MKPSDKKIDHLIPDIMRAIKSPQTPRDKAIKNYFTLQIARIQLNGKESEALKQAINQALIDLETHIPDTHERGQYAIAMLNMTMSAAQDYTHEQTYKTQYRRATYVGIAGLVAMYLWGASKRNAGPAGLLCILAVVIWLFIITPIQTFMRGRGGEKYIPIFTWLLMIIYFVVGFTMLTW